MPTVQETVTDIANEVAQISADIASIDSATTTQAGLVKISDNTLPANDAVPTIGYLKTKSVLDENGNAVAGGGGGGGGTDTSGVVKEIAQTAHGLNIGNWVRFDGTNFVKAQADNAVNAEVVGVVSAVADTDNFTLQTQGFITGFASLTAGVVYFLDPTTPGALTATEPSAVGQVSKPLLMADSDISGYILSFRGLLVGGVDSGAATQEEMELAVNDTKFVTPAKMLFHPGVAKAWVVFDASGTLTVLESFNVSSVSDNGTGNFTITFSTPFATANYVMAGCTQSISGNNDGGVIIWDEDNPPTASNARIRVQDVYNASELIDPARVTIAFFGNQ